MKKIIVSVCALIVLQSCIMTTATKAVTGVAKLGYKAVKGTVKGVSWAVSKANGKIDKDRIDGTWKIVGVYHGSFEQFSQDQNPESSFNSECVDGFDQIVFNSKRSKYKPVHCNTEKESWEKYDFEFGKNPLTKEKENYLEFNSSNYISIIDINSKTMVLEGSLMPKQAFTGGKLYLLEKVK
ncbi:hypothetical protein PQ459_15365 [Chryseobacterium sp. KACC 21268]|nr:hypothetical protein PQ459_15365 [Chryseobacterium sp. KACC 21268]